MSKLVVTPQNVREFLLARYAGQVAGKGLAAKDVPDSFDFFLEGAIDSFGVLEMITALEKEFQVELDMAVLDADRMTILGHLSKFVADQANSR